MYIQPQFDLFLFSYEGFYGATAVTLLEISVPEDQSTQLAKELYRGM